MEVAKMSTQVRPNVFGNLLIPVEQLEKHSGTFQLENQNENITNLSLLTSAVQPFDQVLEFDEEWNYDVLHSEISSIVRAQYGEFYQK